MFNILYQDELLLAVTKPSGMQTISEEDDCFAALVKKELSVEKLLPAHRLDRDTTGVQLFAFEETTLTYLESLFRRRKVSKVYLALCLGIPFNPSGIIRRNLSKWQKGHRPVKVIKGGGGLVAETAYSLIAESSELLTGVSLLKFAPSQGRTHQIRVHAEAFGYPILGDDQYGDRKTNNAVKALTGLGRQALHAWRIGFCHPQSNEFLVCEAPLPNDMRIVCEKYLTGFEKLLELIRSEAP